MSNIRLGELVTALSDTAWKKGASFRKFKITVAHSRWLEADEFFRANEVTFYGVRNFGSLRTNCESDSRFAW